MVMEYLAEALKPIKVVVWGEVAMSSLGAKIFCNVRFSLGFFHLTAYILLHGTQGFMLVPAVQDFLAAVEKLEGADFRRIPWSYATVDPDLLGKNPMTLKIHKKRIRQFERFDQHSV